MESNVVRESRCGHFQHVCVLSAAVFVRRVIFIDRNRAADAVSYYNADTVGIVFGYFIAAVFESLARRFDTQQR